LTHRPLSTLSRRESGQPVHRLTPMVDFDQRLITSFCSDWIGISIFSFLPILKPLGGSRVEVGETKSASKRSMKLKLTLIASAAYFAMTLCQEAPSVLQVQRARATQSLHRAARAKSLSSKAARTLLRQRFLRLRPLRRLSSNNGRGLRDYALNAPSGAGLVAVARLAAGHLGYQSAAASPFWNLTTMTKFCGRGFMVPLEVWL
jgi:hypothetical protein